MGRRHDDPSRTPSSPTIQTDVMGAGATLDAPRVENTLILINDPARRLDRVTVAPFERGEIGSDLFSQSLRVRAGLLRSASLRSAPIRLALLRLALYRTAPRGSLLVHGAPPASRRLVIPSLEEIGQRQRSRPSNRLLGHTQAGAVSVARSVLCKRIARSASSVASIRNYVPDRRNPTSEKTTVFNAATVPTPVERKRSRPRSCR
jgi:hypothetical protein